MADKFITQNSIVAFKVETTAGTYNDPIATDYDVILHDASMPETDYHMSKVGKPANGNLTGSKSQSGMRTVSFSGKTELIYTGDELVAPKDSKLVAVTGLQVTEDGVNPVKYEYAGIAPCNTISAKQTIINCGTSAVGIDRKISGIQAEYKIGADAIGAPIMQEFTFHGADAGEADNASPIRVLQGVDDEDNAEKFLGTLVTIEGTTFKANSFSFEVGAKVTTVGDPYREDNGGIAQHLITDTDCKLTMQVQKIDLAASGLYADIINDTDYTNISFIGKHWDIVITDANLTSRKDSDGDGLVMEDLELEVRAFTITQKN